MEGMLYILIDFSMRVLQVILQVSCSAWLLCHHYYQWGVPRCLVRHGFSVTTTTRGGYTGVLFGMASLSPLLPVGGVQVSCSTWLLCHHYYQWGVSRCLVWHGFSVTTTTSGGFQVSCSAWLFCHHYYQWGVSRCLVWHGFSVTTTTSGG